MHLSLPKRFPLFILASSVCWSLQCLISTLTQGDTGGHIFRLTCSVMLQTNITGMGSQCLGHTGFAPAHGGFPCLHCLGSRLLCWKLSEASPGLYALQRSKLLRFRYSGTPQRHRLGWACVLCPSQVRAVQVTRCLASTVTVTYCLPIPATLFSGCTTSTPSQADVDRPESQEVLVSNEACLQFGR